MGKCRFCGNNVVDRWVGNHERRCSENPNRITPWNKGKTNRIAVNCQNCGGKFEAVPSAVENGRGKYCSTDCMYAGLRIDVTGERYGQLVAIRETKKRAGRKVVWECQCDCGNTVHLPLNALRTGNTKSCGCLPRYDDITGKRYGKLTVINQVNRTKGGDVVWLCKCDCGNETRVSANNMKSGGTASCGCIQEPDLTGKRFGRLVVVEFSGLVPHGRSGNNTRSWLCLCDCGNQNTVKTNNLTTGAVRSCGCLQIDAVSLPENRTIRKVSRRPRRRRRREKRTDDGTVTPHTVRKLLSRVGERCVYCGGDYEHMDHVIPLSRGGEHSIGNVVPACAECNYSKRDKMLGNEWHPPTWGPFSPYKENKKCLLP